MKEVLESNKFKPQHLFIGAMIVNLVLFLFWKTVRLFELEIPNVNSILELFSFIEQATHFISLYFLIWIEKRLSGNIQLKIPILGLIIWEIVLMIVDYAYPLTTVSYSRMALYIPGFILNVMFILFLLKKRGMYASEFKFIGMAKLISTIVMVGFPILFGMIVVDRITEIISYSSLSEILEFVLLWPKIAVLVLMIKSLKESVDTRAEVFENYKI